MALESYDAREVADIPEPPGLPLLGNLWSIDAKYPLASMTALADQYGEIFRLRFPGRTSVVVGSQALVNELCDERRFRKAVGGGLKASDLVTQAFKDEENWGIAHRVLMPAFGPISINGMHDEMHDISTQLTLKWARHGPDHAIDVTSDFTKLTLDMLALCSMGYRFNSFYTPHLHPFVAAMSDFLQESGDRLRRPPLSSFLYREQDRKFHENIDIMRKTAKEVLDSRKAAGDKSGRKDLLTAMLSGVDPKTGKKMTDESVMDNMITFLIAGHETTSATLSFAFYQLLTHPEAFQKAQKEVDETVGTGVITTEHLSKLPYLNGVLRETLRLSAAIPRISLCADEDTLLANKYPVKKDETITLLLAKSQLDPRVFGDDAKEFKPERMMDANFKRTMTEFPNAWKPFGNGSRGCIGRPFAWQEMLLIMTMLLQNFNFVLDPTYTLKVKEGLTTKPDGMHMRVILRDGLTPTILERRLAGMAPAAAPAKPAAEQQVDEKKGGLPMTILYGSNSGTCESLAQRLASDAALHGFRASKVDCLDSARGSLPAGQPVVIITSSYEGQPPDNAGHFVSWLEGSDADAKPLKDTSYAVFGCGNKDWVDTFQRIPTLVDTAMEKLGASRVVEMGLSDVSDGEVFVDFESWEDKVLWPALAARFDVSAAESATPASTMNVTVTNPRATTLRQAVRAATVIKSRTLTGPNAKSIKKHLDIRLPEDMAYAPGDYLAVLPINPSETVHRVLRRFGLSRDAHVEINTAGPAALPVNSSIPANEVLSSYVELSQPVTKRNLLTLIEATKDDATKAELTRLMNDDYDDEIKSKRVSVLDVLERHPSIDLSIGVFLSLLPPMRVRQYSISSSPLADQSTVSITFSVVNAPALSGQGSYIGVATSFLDSLSAGDTLHVAVRPSHAAFSLPADPESTPSIYIAAGAGIAPFRGFVQDRALMLSAGRKVAPAVLFFGCRSPEQDDLYRDEFDEWQRLGAVDVRRAYSQDPDKSEGCKHVQDRITKDGADLLKLWRDGAKIFVCGSKGVGESAKEALIKAKAKLDQKPSEEGTRQHLESLRNIRYVSDIFD